MAKRFSDFEIKKIQELKENSENQNTKKSTTTLRNVWTRRAENNFETTLVACEAKHLDENRQIGLRYWVSQVVVLANSGMICTWYFKIVPNFTRLSAREIMYNNFEISLVVFQLNNTTYHAITYLIYSIFFDFFLYSINCFNFLFIIYFLFHSLFHEREDILSFKEGKGEVSRFWL